MTAPAAEVTRLRARVVVTRRLAAVASIAVNAFVLFAVVDKFVERGRGLTLQAALVLLAAGVFTAALWALLMRLRAPVVRSYLRAVAASRGGVLDLEARGAELTELGRTIQVVAWLAVVLLGAAAFASGDPTGLIPALIALSIAIVLAYYARDGVNPPALLARRRYDRLVVTPKGLEWFVVREKPHTVGWTEIARVTSWSGILRSGVRLEGPSRAPLPISSLRYREPASGEEVDLITIVQAVRPDYVRRRRLRLGTLETAVMPAGPFSW